MSSKSMNYSAYYKYDEETFIQLQYTVDAGRITLNCKGRY